jgi:hypothetical protein
MSLMTSFHSKKRDHNSAILTPFFSRSASKLSGDYVNHVFMRRLAVEHRRRECIPISGLSARGDPRFPQRRQPKQACRTKAVCIHPNVT